MTRRARRTTASLLALCACMALNACSERRARAPAAPVYRDEIADLLAERCGDCHGRDAAAGYSVRRYLDVLACVAGDAGVRRVAGSGDAGGVLLDVLERDDHAGLLNAGEQARLRSWLAAGAPLRGAGLHAAGILNPRSEQWHGTLAAGERFARLLDSKHPEACGRCHDGAPARPLGVTQPAPGATACSECHHEPQGVLACGTCHGDGAGHAYPPRDRCLFAAPASDAHRAHVESTRLRDAPLACSACHPAADASLRGRHADGRVDVRFDPTLARLGARFDPVTRRCAVSCHDREGARAQPRFDEPGPLQCGDCHGAPPANHYGGPCSSCHAEPNADGSALRARTLHMNGRVDVGVSEGRECGACHGAGGDPMPVTPGHVVHRDSVLSAPIVCSDCHVMPEEITSAGHLDRGQATPPDIVFGARARAFGQQPSFEAGVCRNVACHGAGVGESLDRALRWEDRGSPSCSSCHGLPPGGSHPQDDRCATTICHGSEVRAGDPPTISAAGRALHIDGVIDVGAR
jgi:predicted CxxxxCH...CXXCH cytochrome family protein